MINLICKTCLHIRIIATFFKSQYSVHTRNHNKPLCFKLYCVYLTLTIYDTYYIMKLTSVNSLNI